MQTLDEDDRQALATQSHIGPRQAEDAGRPAKAAVELARLNLSYTVITATCDGVTGRKDIHEGQLVQPGQTSSSCSTTRRYAAN